MGLPIDLVLMRHPEAEGGLALKRAKQGDFSLYTEEFLKRHNSLWRATYKGREQAKMAGAWIRENIGEKFNRYYCSEFLRTKEGAALLDLPDARWQAEADLNERDLGLLDAVLADTAQTDRMVETVYRRQAEGYSWEVEGGESIPGLCQRVGLVLAELCRTGADGRVIVVSHGMVMWAFRILLERLSRQQYEKLTIPRDPREHIYNCHILHYSRRDPRDGFVGDELDWMRSVCPTDLSLSTNDWRWIGRLKCSNEELLADVGQVMPLVTK